MLAGWYPHASQAQFRERRCMEHEQDAGYILFATEALLKRLQALTQEMDGVRQAQDIECIHRMRVASRRLRSAITLFEECLPRKKLPDWQKQVRRITRALGAARDTDVQIDLLDQVLRHLKEPSAEDGRRYQPGIERLRLRLRQRREKLQADVNSALDAWEASQVTEELGQTLRQQLVQARLSQVEAASPRVYQQAYLITSLRLEEMLAYDACVYHPEQIEELHAMRIAAKRLRYTMEVFEPLYDNGLKQPLQTVREVQEVLGDIHDCDVWVQVLPQFIEEERTRTLKYFGHTRSFGRLTAGLMYLQQERQRHRTQRYQEFVEFWQQTQRQDVWGGLRQTLRSRLAEAISTPQVQPPAEETSP
jgi:CHAD domain-containing protein